MGTGPAAVPAATPPLAQPSRRTVELGAVRRAARVAIAACVAFYTCQYLLGASVTALYALFTVIALGALSDVQGSPRQRAHAYLGAVAAGLPLVTLGTYAAVSTWVAAAGMLAVGFAVAYSGVGGPRVAGVANGLQLFYVLPCFPPFAPDTLGQRLAGLVVGGLLLAAVDRWLWPVTPPAPPGTRLAKAAGQLAEYAAHLDAGLRAPAGSVGASGLAAPTTVEAAAATLRLTQLPTAERPLGPGIRDRSLLAAGNATRTAATRLATLGELLAAPGARPHRLVADLVAATGAAFAGMAAALRRSATGSLAHRMPASTEARRWKPRSRPTSTTGTEEGSTPSPRPPSCGSPSPPSTPRTKPARPSSPPAASSGRHRPARSRRRRRSGFCTPAASSCGGGACWDT